MVPVLLVIVTPFTVVFIVVTLAIVGTAFYMAAVMLWGALRRVFANRTPPKWDR